MAVPRGTPLGRSNPNSQVYAPDFFEVDVPNVYSRDVQSRTFSEFGSEVHSNRLASKIVTSSLFQLCINSVILVNAIQMGIAADVKDPDIDRVWGVCDHIFTAVFCLELMLQLWSQRWKYFTLAWNWMDFVVVVVAVLDTWIFSLIHSGADGVQVFRVFRLFRLMRFVKFMRVFPQLKVVVEGLLASMQSMAWVFLLLLILLYMFAICCRELIGGSSMYPGRSTDDSVIRANVVNDFNSYVYFGNVARSMISLFSIVLLAEWEDIVRPVYEMQPYTIFVFAFLVGLGAFGILNVIIGIVVERTTLAMSSLRKQEWKRTKKEQEAMLLKLGHILFNLDVDSNDRLSREELENGQNDETLGQILGHLPLPYGFTFAELFSMLDSDGSGWLSKAEFTRGVMRLVWCDQFQRDCCMALAIGQAKQANMSMKLEIQRDTKLLLTRMDNLEEKLEAKLRHMSESPEAVANTRTQDPMPPDRGANVNCPSETRVDSDNVAGCFELGPCTLTTSNTVPAVTPSASSAKNTEKRQRSPHREEIQSALHGSPDFRWEALETAMIPLKLLTGPTSQGVHWLGGRGPGADTEKCINALDPQLHKGLGASAGNEHSDDACLSSTKVMGLLPLLHLPEDIHTRRVLRHFLDDYAFMRL